MERVIGMEELKIAIIQLLKNIYLLITLPQLYVIIMPFIIYKIIKTVQYKKTAYYKETKTPLKKVNIMNKGARGEYLLYKNLSPMEKENCKFLFNIYIPNDKGELTEIDVIMICKEGIFVFESKNYSGWIYGDETQRKWTQTLPADSGRSEKHQFYNPILQNQSHVKCLKRIIGDESPIYPIVVFSDRCEFKKLNISTQYSVIHRDDVLLTVKNILEKAEIHSVDVEKIYKQLKPFADASQDIKQAHIDRINNIYENK